MHTMLIDHHFQDFAARASPYIHVLTLYRKMLRLLHSLFLLFWVEDESLTIQANIQSPELMDDCGTSSQKKFHRQEMAETCRMKDLSLGWTQVQ